MIPLNRLARLFVLGDFVAGMISWALFFIWRKQVVIRDISWQDLIADSNFLIGIIVVPLLWLSGMYILGHYRAIWQKSRLATLYETIIAIFIGSIFILFVLIADDDTLLYASYVRSFFTLFLITLGLFGSIRILILSIIHEWLEKGKIPLNALLIGKQEEGNELKSCYHNIFQIQSIDENVPLDQLAQVNTVLWANPTKAGIKGIYDIAYRLSNDVDIEIIHESNGEEAEPAELSYNVVGDRLYFILDRMPYWQQGIKRLIDVMISIVALILLSPIFLYLGIRVKMSSPGSIFFTQERLGKKAKPFHIIKFRSMYVNAEEDGPALSYDGDDRCTDFGRFMRRYRLDELPQFYNVLIGDMSIVGPRPERAHFIDQLSKEIKGYGRIFLVRPGITSWGQVKYGYASSIAQMKKRLQYDILYMKNRSLFLDFKIMVYTLYTLLKGEGN